jgi:hypothetical protein
MRDGKRLHGDGDMAVMAEDQGFDFIQVMENDGRISQREAFALRDQLRALRLPGRFEEAKNQLGRDSRLRDPLAALENFLRAKFRRDPEPVTVEACTCADSRQHAHAYIKRGGEKLFDTPIFSVEAGMSYLDVLVQTAQISPVEALEASDQLLRLRSLSMGLTEQDVVALEALVMAKLQRGLARMTDEPVDLLRNVVVIGVVRR